MIKVLFVCLGNICRSPLAEAIFKHKVEKLGLSDRIQSDSAGTSNYHIGEDPDHRSIQVAIRHQVPITHKGRQLHHKDGETFDYILAMDKTNHRDIIHMLADRPEGLYLMREFDEQAKGADVPDPYYGGEDGFEQVFGMLDRSLDVFLNMIRKKHNL